MAFSSKALGNYVIVRLQTDDGIHGLGEATVMTGWGGDYGRYYGESPELTVNVIQSVLGPALIGEDPFAIERAHDTMNTAIKGYPYAKTAIDMALYDIKGKALDVPAYELLGGLFRQEIPIAHSLG